MNRHPIRYATFIVGMLILTSCKDEPQPGTTPDVTVAEEEKSVEVAVDPVSPESQQIVFDLERWKNGFFYTTQVLVFNEDSVGRFESLVWEDYKNPRKYCLPITGELEEQIMQSDAPITPDSILHEGTGFLYSIQTQNGHIGITIFQMNGGWEQEIKYLSYDMRGRKIDEAILAVQGGDGGYHKTAHGEFINDSTYHFAYAESEYNTETLKMDTVKTGLLQYIIHQNGKITTRKP